MGWLDAIRTHQRHAALLVRPRLMRCVPNSGRVSTRLLAKMISSARGHLGQRGIARVIVDLLHPILT